MDKFEIRGLVFDTAAKKWKDKRVSFQLFSSKPAANAALKSENYKSCMNPYIAKVSKS